MSLDRPGGWLRRGVNALVAIGYVLAMTAWLPAVLTVLVMRSCRHAAPAALQAGRWYWKFSAQGRYEFCGPSDTWRYLLAGGWSDFAVLAAGFALLVPIAAIAMALTDPKPAVHPPADRRD